MDPFIRSDFLNRFKFSRTAFHWMFTISNVDRSNQSLRFPFQHADRCRVCEGVVMGRAFAAKSNSESNYFCFGEKHSSLSFINYFLTNPLSLPSTLLSINIRWPRSKSRSSRSGHRNRKIPWGQSPPPRVPCAKSASQ